MLGIVPVECLQKQREAVDLLRLLMNAKNEDGKVPTSIYGMDEFPVPDDLATKEDAIHDVNAAIHDVLSFSIYDDTPTQYQ